MNSIERAVFLQTTPVFHEATTEALNALGAISREQLVAAQQVVFAQDDPADAFYVIVSGHVRYECDGRTVRTRHLRDVLGLWSAFDGELRRFAAVAETPCRLLRVSYADFQDLVVASAGLGRGLQVELAREIRDAQDRARVAA